MPVETFLILGPASLSAVLYAAKCYWPGVSETDIEQLAERASRARTSAGHAGVAYLGSLLFSGDDLVLCLFEGPSRSAVQRASDRLRIPCERLIDSVWLERDRLTKRGPDQ
jgi:hypothetical protein